MKSLTGFAIFMLTMMLFSAFATRQPVKTMKDLSGIVSSNVSRLDISLMEQTEINATDFNIFTKLSAVIIQHGVVNTIAQGTFSILNITYLTLYNNSIQNIPPRSMPASLEYCDLGLNEIEAIRKDMFDGLLNMERLWLHKNKIHTIENGAFNSMTNLTELLLYGNHLTQFPKDMQLPLLNRLQLHENVLTQLDAKMFSGLPKMESFTVGSNLLKTLGDDLLPLFKTFITFDVANNPIHCNCLTDWILSDPRVRGKSGRYSCATPQVTHLSNALIHICTAPTILQITPNSTVQLGETVKLNCTARGDLAPNITWILPDGTKKEFQPPTKPSILVTNGILETFPKQNGSYICEARNNKGHAVEEMHIYIEEVISLNKITTQEIIKETEGNTGDGSDTTAVTAAVCSTAAVGVAAGIGIGCYVYKKKKETKVGQSKMEHSSDKEINEQNITDVTKSGSQL